MGCNSCSSGGGTPKGCRNNGTCGTSGCNKFTVFDWLANMDLPDGQKPFDWVEVRFKNGRKEFYKNVHDLTLQIGDVVAVESSPGHDVGAVSIIGDLVRVQMNRKKFDYNNQALLKKVYRKANQRDIDLWTEARNREQETMYQSRVIAAQMGLDMKISDVEYQGDGAKATFYYTAEGRVDFRQLIRQLAGNFNIRVEMRQIGARQEAARLGGIGSCGRELCCSTWLTDFRTVNTSAARYQQLALNPQKLAGQCGKLKCCLNYELDSYLEALSTFPETQTRLKTVRGEAIFQKRDIFKKIMWYAYTDEVLTWVPLQLEDVLQIMELNEKGEMPPALESYRKDDPLAEPEITNVVGQDDLNRFDNKGGSRNRKKGYPAAKAQTGKPNQGRPKVSAQAQNAAQTPSIPNKSIEAGQNRPAQAKDNRGPRRNKKKFQRKKPDNP
jgi:cell fate regulator YaaT (PSP1 superfamily)